jgi:hypothetical protein
MDALGTPTAAPPVMFGAPAPPGELLPWSWAQQRLTAAHAYRIATTRPDGRPHCRPVWGVWLPDGFWFSTGSLARHNLIANPQITVHLDSGTEVVIVEGVAAAVAGVDGLEAFLADYNTKYGWDAFATADGVADSSGGGRAGLPGAAACGLWLGHRLAHGDPVVVRRLRHGRDPVGVWVDLADRGPSGDPRGNAHSAVAGPVR